MLKKDFLLFLHEDWKRNAQQLSEELALPHRNRKATQERVRIANEWMTLYARQLRDLYGVEL